MALTEKQRRALELATTNKDIAKAVADAIDAGANDQATAVEDQDTADGDDAASTQALANSNKEKINELLAALRAAGIMAE